MAFREAEAVDMAGGAGRRGRRGGSGLGRALYLDVGDSKEAREPSVGHEKPEDHGEVGALPKPDNNWRPRSADGDARGGGSSGERGVPERLVDAAAAGRTGHRDEGRASSSVRPRPTLPHRPSNLTWTGLTACSTAIRRCLRSRTAASVQSAANMRVVDVSDDAQGRRRS